MPTPRKKQSRTKRGARRSHDALATPATSICPQCGEPKRPHIVCSNCGTYKGKEVIKSRDLD